MSVVREASAPRVVKHLVQDVAVAISVGWQVCADSVTADASIISMGVSRARFVCVSRGISRIVCPLPAALRMRGRVRARRHVPCFFSPVARRSNLHRVHLSLAFFSENPVPRHSSLPGHAPLPRPQLSFRDITENKVSVTLSRACCHPTSYVGTIPLPSCPSSFAPARRIVPGLAGSGRTPACWQGLNLTALPPRYLPAFPLKAYRLRWPSHSVRGRPLNFFW